MPENTPPNSDQKPTPPQNRPPEQGGDSEGQKSSQNGSFRWFMIFIGLVLIGVFAFSSNSMQGDQIDYLDFLVQLEKGNISEASTNGDYLIGTYKQAEVDPDNPDQKEEKFHTKIPRWEDRTLLTLLKEHGVSRYEDKTQELGPITQSLIMIVGFMLVMIIFMTIMRRNSDPMGQGGMFGGFIRSPAKQFQASDRLTTFNDIAGMEQPKTELNEIVEFLKNPAKFQKLGAQIPKGVLLMGPPGTGKTLLARAVAGEAEVPFFSISGSEFIQMFVGVGASRVRDLFKVAKEQAPSIIFIDEIDAVGRMRGAGYGGGHDEREQTLNQILSEMDGFTQADATIVVAATNRPDVLDKALTRPGRFDRHVVVDLPSKKGREGILKVHSRKVPLAEDVNLEQVAASTIGFSGADLKNLVNEAALHATRESKSVVEPMDFETALDRVTLGVKREEILTDKEKRMTAYHEAGHAVIAWYLPELDPVHKVTIVPRGRALGITQLRPSEERMSLGEKRAHSQLSMLMGGRVAERLIFDEVSAGASGDLNQATDLARKMVSHWGMSATIGPAAFRHAEEDPFLGRDMQQMRSYSDETAHQVDQEIQRILFAADDLATSMLNEYREKLDQLALELIETEILGPNDIERILGKREGDEPASPAENTEE